MSFKLGFTIHACELMTFLVCDYRVLTMIFLLTNSNLHSIKILLDKTDIIIKSMTSGSRNHTYIQVLKPWFLNQNVRNFLAKSFFFDILIFSSFSLCYVLF